MALSLTNYETIVGIASTTPQIIYTAPAGYTGVVLMGQVANLSSRTEIVLFSYVNAAATTTEITPSCPVASNDAIKLFYGKLFVLSGESIKLSGTNGTSLKYTFSILETLN